MRCITYIKCTVPDRQFFNRKYFAPLTLNSYLRVIGRVLKQYF